MAIPELVFGCCSVAGLSSPAAIVFFLIEFSGVQKAAHAKIAKYQTKSYCSVETSRPDFCSLPSLILAHCRHCAGDRKKDEKGAGNLQPKQMGGVFCRCTNGFGCSYPCPHVVVLLTTIGEGPGYQNGPANLLNRNHFTKS